MFPGALLTYRRRMSGDEFIALMGSFGFTLFAIHQLVVVPLRVRQLIRRRVWLRCPAAVAAALAFLWIVLSRWSSFDVRSNPAYMTFYMVMGAGWSGACLVAWNWLGLSYRDDVVERSNRAAALALSGALVGNLLGFTGANIGDGPGWWVVVFCAGLAGLFLFAGWLILQGLAGIQERITIDRDSASGAHVGGLMSAAGLVLGRSVAGNWASATETLMDFLQISGSFFLLFFLAGIIERSARGSFRPGEFSLVRGWALPLLYWAAAFLIVRAAGPW